MKTITIRVKEYANANVVVFEHNGIERYRKILDLDQSTDEYVDWIKALYSALGINVAQAYEN